MEHVTGDYAYETAVQMVIEATNADEEAFFRSIEDDAHRERIKMIRARLSN